MKNLSRDESQGKNKTKETNDKSNFIECLTTEKVYKNISNITLYRLFMIKEIINSYNCPYDIITSIFSFVFIINRYLY